MLFLSLNRISETGFLRYSRSEKQNKSTLHFVFRSLNRIFEINSKILALVAKKYSSKLDIFLLVYSYL